MILGPKAMSGYAGIDNGFARFDHVRVPRAQMLSKFAQVMKDGTYVKPPHAKLSYGGVSSLRLFMLTQRDAYRKSCVDALHSIRVCMCHYERIESLYYEEWYWVQDGRLLEVCFSTCHQAHV